jgi:glutamate-1-semialdehyde 2,1-aminomutase
VSALAGKREYMRLGDLEQWDKPRVFLLSTTHGGETHGLAAMMATMDVYANEPVIDHMITMGKRLMTGIEQAARARGVHEHITVSGMPSNAVFGTTDPEKKPSQAYRSLFLQELIQRGVLAPSIVVSYAHKEADIDQTIAAFDGAMEVYARALNDGAEKYLVGRPSQMVYRTFNQRP